MEVMCVQGVGDMGCMWLCGDGVWGRVGLESEGEKKSAWFPGGMSRGWRAVPASSK